MKFTENSTSRIAAEAQSLLNEIASLPEMKLSAVSKKSAMAVFMDIVNGFIREGAMASARIEDIIKPNARLLSACSHAGILTAAFADCHKENAAEFLSFPPHCIENTDGWQIDASLDTAGAMIFDKPSFGSEALVRYLKSLNDLRSAEFVGLCTDICVITNVLSTKCALPELPISVDSACCAGVTPDSHENALAAMRMCQIRIL